MTLPRFRNINYPYANDDDTFIARGYHLNQLRDEINLGESGAAVEVAASAVVDITLGLSTEIDAVFIYYKILYVGADYPDEVGKLEIKNSMEHATVGQQDVTIERESSTLQSSEDVDIDSVRVGLNLMLRVTNNYANDIVFLYSPKIMTYDQN